MKSNFYIVSDSTIQKESNFNQFVANSKSFTFIGKLYKGYPLAIDLSTTKRYKMSIGTIAKFLNISCQEVCNQFNQMAKESSYKLFN